MKVFRFACNFFIFLLVACAFVCAFRPVQVFAQDGRESLEIARQRELFETFVGYSNLYTQAAAVDRNISEAGWQFYRFLLLCNPDDAYRANEIARDTEDRLKDIRINMKDQGILSILNGLVKSNAEYKDEFAALRQERQDFLNQYRDLVAPLSRALETETAGLAKTAAATGDTELWPALTSHMLHIAKIRTAMADFSHMGEEQYYVMALENLQIYMERLHGLKEIAGPEMAADFNQVSYISKQLLDASKRFGAMGHDIDMRASKIARNLDQMKGFSEELAGVLYEHRRAVIRDLDRSIF